MLNKFVNNMELRLRDFEDYYIDKNTLETSDVIDGARRAISLSDRLPHYQGFRRAWLYLGIS